METVQIAETPAMVNHPLPGPIPSAQSSVRTGALRIAAFFCVVVAALFLTDSLVNAGLRRIRTSSFGVTNRIVNGQINADILVTGSSRAQVHYDPQVIREVTGRSAFNIGINGSQTDLQVAMLKVYLAHNRKPELIIHNLDLYSFQTTREIYDPAQYLPYLRENHVYEAIRRVYPADAWKWKWLPLYGYATQDLRFTWINGPKALVGLQPRETHRNGYTPRYLEWTGDFEKLRDSHAAGVTFEIEPQGVRDLEEIPQLCQQHGIPLILVYSPEYIEMQELEQNRDEIFSVFRKIAERYNSKLWDYSSSQISQEKRFFYNSQHLNAAGAATYSNSISARLRDEHFGEG